MRHECPCCHQDVAAEVHAQAAIRVADAALAEKAHREGEDCFRPRGVYCMKCIALVREYRAALACYSVFAEPVTGRMSDEAGSAAECGG